MKLAKYSNEIFRYATKTQATDYLKVNKATLERLAVEAKAKVKIGRSARYDIPKIVALLEEKYTL